MKKIVAVVLALALILSFSAVAMAENVIKIGVYEPASGDSGAGGKQETLGIQYANSVQPTVDIGGQTYNVQLVYADNGSSADKAPSAAQQLVSEGRIPLYWRSTHCHTHTARCIGSASTHGRPWGAG